MTYTCPMHPELQAKKRGTCPNCGMALEPMTMTVAAPPAVTEYVCPMHPQVVRNAPAACPICGMVLDPRTVYGVNPCAGGPVGLVSVARTILAV